MNECTLETNVLGCAVVFWFAVSARMWHVLSGAQWSCLILIQGARVGCAGHQIQFLSVRRYQCLDMYEQSTRNTHTYTCMEPYLKRAVVPSISGEAFAQSVFRAPSVPTAVPEHVALAFTALTIQGSTAKITRRVCSTFWAVMSAVICEAITTTEIVAAPVTCITQLCRVNVTQSCLYEYYTLSSKCWSMHQRWRLKEILKGCLYSYVIIHVYIYIYTWEYIYIYIYIYMRIDVPMCM